MSEPINLNKARKARNKLAEARKAAENRAIFGAPKAEKKALKSIKTRAETQLDGHLLRPNGGKTDPS
jgi:hypothetical protein